MQLKLDLGMLSASYYQHFITYSRNIILSIEIIIVLWYYSICLKHDMVSNIDLIGIKAFDYFEYRISMHYHCDASRVIFSYASYDFKFPLIRITKLRFSFFPPILVSCEKITWLSCKMGIIPQESHIWLTSTSILSYCFYFEVCPRIKSMTLKLWI